MSIAPAHRNSLRALISGMRVHQWVKNGLLAVAPVAAGTFFHRQVFVHTLLAIASFSLVASALYLLNDL